MKNPREFSKKNQIILSLCLILGIAGIWILRSPMSDFFTLLANREGIVDYLERSRGWGPFVLFLILSMQVFLAVIPGHAFMVAGGYIYGFLFGFALTQASTVLASQIAYILTRRYGRPFVQRIARASVIDKWNALAEKQGGFFFFLSFILPIFPNDLMSFIAGLSTIKPKHFFIANFFGRLPCAILITLIGSHGVEIPLQYWVGIGLVILGLCISWKRISKHIEARINPKTVSVRC